MVRWPAPTHQHRTRRLLLQLAGVVVVIAVVVALWNRGQDLINGEASGVGVYLTVIALVFGDALIPVLPGESTLNAAVILSSNGDLSFWLIVLCGAIGAITGDSALYWLARKSTGRIRTWLDKAAGAKAGVTVTNMLDRYGNIFLLFGRYIPGLRFALNVTLGGVVKMP
jgi:membrane-associated protein